MIRTARIKQAKRAILKQTRQIIKREKILIVLVIRKSLVNRIILLTRVQIQTKFQRKIQIIQPPIINLLKINKTKQIMINRPFRTPKINNTPITQLYKFFQFLIKPPNYNNQVV
jgi:hypothetical protein